MVSNLMRSICTAIGGEEIHEADPTELNLWRELEGFQHLLDKAVLRTRPNHVILLDLQQFGSLTEQVNPNC